MYHPKIERIVRGDRSCSGPVCGTPDRSGGCIDDDSHR